MPITKGRMAVLSGTIREASYLQTPDNGESGGETSSERCGVRAIPPRGQTAFLTQLGGPWASSGSSRSRRWLGSLNRRGPRA